MRLLCADLGLWGIGVGAALPTPLVLATPPFRFCHAFWGLCRTSTLAEDKCFWHSIVATFDKYDVKYE